MDLSQVTKFNIPDPSPIAGYTKLDYIEATGSQYIDTGFYAKPTTAIEIDHEFTDLTVQQRLWGCIGDLYYQSYINGSGRYAYAYQNSSGNWVNTQQTTRTERHIAKLDGKNGKYQLDGIYSVNLSGGPTNTATNTLWLTGYDNAGTPTNLASIKVYSCKIWDNGTLVRDYIPVKNNNNIAGLYDLVNEQFYHSGSGTEYAAGNELYTVEVTKLNINSVTMWEKPAKVLSSITLVSATTSLSRGATYAFGGAVIANYNDGSKAYVTTSTTFSGYNMSTAGTYTVTAKYIEGGVTKTATYSLTVNKAWTQVWSGSKSKTTTTTAGSNVDVWTGVSLTGSQQLRFTYSATVSGSGTTQYYTGSWSTTQPSSPVSRTFNMSSGTTNVFGVRKYNSGPEVRTSLYYNATDKKFYLSGYIASGGISNASVKLTITKIERYY